MKAEKTAKAAEEAAKREEQKRLEEKKRLEQENINIEKRKREADKREVEEKVRADQMRKLLSTSFGMVSFFSKQSCYADCFRHIVGECF